MRKHGKSFAHPLVVLIVLPNDLSYSRFAVVAGRSVGTAVIRNRVKRLIRASINSIYEDSRQGVDAIIIARKASAKSSYKAIKTALVTLMIKAGLLL